MFKLRRWEWASSGCLMSMKFHRSHKSNRGGLSPLLRQVVRWSFSDSRDALFRFTAGTWLYNRDQQLSQRYLPFNVDALVDIATKSVGAERCTSFVKIGEGTSNRVFLLTFDTGDVAVARLPFPVAGPPHFTTASEVATMEYARLHLGIPVPRVISWCSHADQTNVGSEYILMEKIPGVELHTRWYDPDVKGKPLAKLIEDYVGLEKTLAETPFSQIGSLYFVEDVNDELKSRRLYAPGFPDNPASERFRIGPSVDPRFWRGKRARLNIDRGPWNDSAAYLHAAVECEIAWLTRFAEPFPRHHPRFRRGDGNDPEAHVSLLRQFLQLLPYVSPPSHLCTPVLWHPDLHASNLFLSSSGTLKITGFTDWQTAVVQPLITQVVAPGFLHYDGGEYVNMISANVAKLPDNFSELSEANQQQAEQELKAAHRFQAYTMLTRDGNPTLHTARTYPDAIFFNVPFWTVSRTWDEGLGLLRKCLIDICDAWQRLGPPGMQCPVVFTERERWENTYEQTQWDLNRELSSFHAKIGVEEEGGVPWDKYAIARRKNLMVLHDIISGKIPLESLPGELHEKEVDEIIRVWPFQDGALSLTAEPCR